MENYKAYRVRDYTNIKNLKSVVIENDYPYSNIPELPLCEYLIINCKQSLKFTDNGHKIVIHICAPPINQKINESNFFETLYDHENIYLLSLPDKSIYYAGPEINCYKQLRAIRLDYTNGCILQIDEYLNKMIQAGTDLTPVLIHIAEQIKHPQNKRYNLIDHLDKYIQKQMAIIMSHPPIKTDILQQFMGAFAILENSSFWFPRCYYFIKQNKPWINILLNHHSIDTSNPPSLSQSLKI